TSVLQATEAIKGSLTRNSIFDSNILDGKILISLAHNQGFSGDGSVAYIRFNVIGVEGSWSRLDIDDLSANRANDLASMNVETVDGVFTVLSIEETIADCDGDGKISAVDALCALQMAVGKKAEDLSMDVNNDGKVTSLDARKILQTAIRDENPLTIGAFDNNVAPVEGTQTDLINAFGKANTEAERQAALQEVLIQGVSMGVVDEDGNQLNPNALYDEVSFTPDDMASLTEFIEVGHYRTIGEVVDFLASIDVLLASTGEVITFQDLLPDLESYIDWSFGHKDEPGAMLGLLIASGPSLETPSEPPVIESTTLISPVVAILMLADFLIGIEDEIEEMSSSQKTNNQFTTVSFNRTHKIGSYTDIISASDVQEAARKVAGWITVIELGQGGVQLIEKAIEMAGGSSSSQPSKPLVPEVAKRIIAAFAVGNHFGVRVTSMMSKVVNSIVIDPKSGSEPLGTMLALIPSGQIIKGLPMIHSLNLIGPNELGSGNPLYPDADAVFKPVQRDWFTSQVERSGHRLGAATIGKPDEGGVLFIIEANKLDNTEPRSALLHASAIINTPDLQMLFDKYSEKYGKKLSAIQVTQDELIKTFEIMKTGLKVSPWITVIVLKGSEDKEQSQDQDSIRKERLLRALQSSELMISVVGKHNYNYTDRDDSGLTTGGCGWNGGDRTFFFNVKEDQISWKGTKFTVNIRDATTVYNDVIRVRIVTANGEVEWTKTENNIQTYKLASFTMTETIKDTYPDSSDRLTYNQGFTVTNVDLTGLTGLSNYLYPKTDSPAIPSSYEIKGCVYGDLKKHASGLSLNCTMLMPPPYTSHDYSYTNTTFTDQSNVCVYFR
ncbi:MAG: hypothetical protein GY845_35000, partial [Planctomycetes bacterium]|nr:hypothetical protein [Planctomycetota bacterium]